MQRMNDSLVSIGFGQNNIFNKVVVGGQHNEKLWREAFGEAYLWLFDSYTTSIEDSDAIKTIQCFPNPVGKILSIRNGKKTVYDTIRIMDMKGQQIKINFTPHGNDLDVNDLMPGAYIIKCYSGKEVYEGKFVKK
jgi:hypothetical protein